ncbi:MAG TPA: trehalose-phosphatase [Geomobilimonas sp.]|nr:trehalose-phosphatase [Geomobilimonas sp.]
MTSRTPMTYLFSDAGRAALRRFVDRATLFAFDLDGTLAPIVADPDRILIPQDTRERLMRLNRMAPVAIITGRARADARKHLGFNPRYLVGNHGAEGLPGGEKHEEEFCRQCKEWQDQLKILMPHASECGIFIENKGATLSLHYRNASDPDAANKTLVQAISQLKPPPRRIPGKYVENIVPYGAPHKGEALSQLMRQTGWSRALFVGDDATDEDVFSLMNDRILGVRVGCEGSSLAGYCLSDQREILDVLNEIIRLTLQIKDSV